ncbi:hypothetical protein [Bradyrhizobium pachyrhizi]|uniref:hypothetical protein n=1 Tax=Bradyrhizobium pachyrhizi TaxID=280333 RepID=UPI00067CC1B0|nr:hypothetical protein [Bradyrhizobium pachyrhizi]
MAQNQELNVEEAMLPLADTYNIIRYLLTETLVLGRDPALRQMVVLAGGGAAGRPVAFTRRKRDVWIAWDDLNQPSVSRSPPADHLILDLDAITQAPEIASAYRHSVKASGAGEVAASLLAPAFGRDALMTRRDFEELVVWSPLLEHSWYKAAAELSVLVDKLRRSITDRISRAEPLPYVELNRYWRTVHSMAHLVLLASISGRLWMPRMIRELPFSNWTPTLWLVNARTTWLTAVAARSVLECGDAAIERYLKILVGSRQPMVAFDALFGLATLGLSLPAERSLLRAELYRAKEVHLPAVREHSVHFELAYSNALWLLSCDNLADLPTDAFVPLKWKRNGVKGLATSSALYGDPTEIAPSGRYMGFAMLPFVLGQQPEAYYPKILQPNPSPGKVARLLARELSPSEQMPLPATATLH